MSAYPHLLEQVAAYMEASPNERIVVARSDRWIGYAKAKSVLDDLDQLVVYPLTQRPLCRLILARGDNGKTALLRQFQLRHRMKEREDGTMCAPVIRVGMPASPDLSQLWSEILTRCATTHRRSDPAHVKYQMVVAVLRSRGTRVLAIDEFNDVSLARKNAADILAGIRKLSNDLNLSIVAAGTEVALNALSFDPQMKSRFTAVSLPRWQLDMGYLNFLNTYERLLPLAKPSGLASEKLAPLLFELGSVAIGGTVKTLREAAAIAITEGKEQITEEIIRRASDALSHETAKLEI